MSDVITPYKLVLLFFINLWIINQDEAANYPFEFLNSLNLPGPWLSHLIVLLIINQLHLCDGTRLAIKKLFSYIIEAIVSNLKFKTVLILCIPSTWFLLIYHSNQISICHKNEQFIMLIVAVVCIEFGESMYPHREWCVVTCSRVEN